MYEEIFNQMRYAANKRNLKDSTIHAYCTSVAHFLNHTAKDIDALTNDDVDIFLTEKRLSGVLQTHSTPPHLSASLHSQVSVRVPG